MYISLYGDAYNQNHHVHNTMIVPFLGHPRWMCTHGHDMSINFEVTASNTSSNCDTSRLGSHGKLSHYLLLICHIWHDRRIVMVNDRTHRRTSVVHYITITLDTLDVVINTWLSFKCTAPLSEWQNTCCKVGFLPEVARVNLHHVVRVSNHLAGALQQQKGVHQHSVCSRSITAKRLSWHREMHLPCH